jgi:uncharacterized protein
MVQPEYPNGVEEPSLPAIRSGPRAAAAFSKHGINFSIGWNWHLTARRIVEMIATSEPEVSSGLIRNVSLPGPAGRLEALLNEGAPGARYAALVCHPHPLGGGTMHNKVVYHAMKVLNDRAWGFGFPVLRFNFRGAGLSDGAHHGGQEAEDVLAALDWMREEFHLPMVVAGFSFGAAMSLSAGCGGGHDVRALAALGLPTNAWGRDYNYGFLKSCVLPKLFLSGDSDEFAPAADLQRIAASAAEPRKLILVPGADHFFSGRLEAMQNALSGWLKERLP